MSTGPEHFAEAERLLRSLESLSPSTYLERAAQVTAEAQVHATLALAAATGVRSEHAADEWIGVAGGKPKPRARTYPSPHPEGFPQ